MNIGEVLIDVFLEFAGRFMGLYGAEAIEGSVEKQVIEVSTDRMSQRNLVETRSLLGFNQVFLLQILILLQVALNLLHGLGLNEGHMDLLGLWGKQTRKVLGTCGQCV